MKLLKIPNKKRFTEIGRAKIESILFLLVDNEYNVTAYNKMTGTLTPLIFLPERKEVWSPNRREIQALSKLEEFPMSKLRHLKNTEFAVSHPDLYEESLIAHKEYYNGE